MPAKSQENRLTMTNLNVAVSACLLGENVRYDGGHKLCSAIADDKIPYLVRHPVCPEVAIGLGVPRPTLHLIGDGKGALSMVTQESGEDYTVAMNEWSSDAAERIRQDQICGLILKSRSPSCGIGDVLVEGPAPPNRRTGSGLFSRTVGKTLPGLPLINEVGFTDLIARDEFLASAFAYKRACAFFSSPANHARLRDFHQLHESYLDDLDDKENESLTGLLGESNRYKGKETLLQYGALFLARANFGIWRSGFLAFFHKFAAASSTSLGKKEREDLLRRSLGVNGSILETQLQLGQCLPQSDRQLWIHNPTDAEIEMRRYLLELEQE